jgi:hypothetical protein
VTESGLSRNPSPLKYILQFRGLRKKLKAQPGGEAASPSAYAIGTFIGFHGLKKRIKKNSNSAVYLP